MFLQPPTSCVLCLLTNFPFSPGKPTRQNFSDTSQFQLVALRDVMQVKTLEIPQVQQTRGLGISANSESGRVLQMVEAHVACVLLRPNP